MNHGPVGLQVPLFQRIGRQSRFRSLSPSVPRASLDAAGIVDLHLVLCFHYAFRGGAGAAAARGPWPARVVAQLQLF